MLSWLYRRNETYIEAFDFKPLKRIDRGDEADLNIDLTLSYIEKPDNLDIFEIKDGDF